jgi:hypothetical protein
VSFCHPWWQKLTWLLPFPYIAVKSPAAGIVHIILRYNCINEIPPNTVSIFIRMVIVDYVPGLVPGSGRLCAALIGQPGADLSHFITHPAAQQHTQPGFAHQPRASLPGVNFCFAFRYGNTHRVQHTQHHQPAGYPNRYPYHIPHGDHFPHPNDYPYPQPHGMALVHVHARPNPHTHHHPYPHPTAGVPAHFTPRSIFTLASTDPN